MPLPRSWDSNERAVIKHQHIVGGHGQTSASRLSSLSFGAYSSPLSGWPEVPTDVCSRSTTQMVPDRTQLAQFQQILPPPGQQHSPPSQGPQVAPWVLHPPRVRRHRREKKKKVNLMGLLENSPCKEVKGRAEESPSRPRETAHSSILPGLTQGRGTTCHGLGDSHTGTSL